MTTTTGGFEPYPGLPPEDGKCERCGVGVPPGTWPLFCDECFYTIDRGNRLRAKAQDSLAGPNRSS